MTRRLRNSRTFEKVMICLGMAAVAVGAGCALVLDIDPDSLPRQAFEAGRGPDGGEGSDAGGGEQDGGTSDARGGPTIPSFVSESTAKTSAGQQYIVVSRPPGTAVDDVLLAAIFANDRDNAVTLPEQWLLLHDSSSLPCDMRAVWAYHTIGAAEPASYMFKQAKTNLESMGAIVAYRGVNPQLPIDTKRMTLFTDAASAYASEGIRSSGPNRMLVFLAVNDGNDGTWREPDNMTLRVTREVIGIFDELRAATGESGSRTAYPSKAGCGGIELTFLAPRPQ